MFRKGLTLKLQLEAYLLRPHPVILQKKSYGSDIVGNHSVHINISDDSRVHKANTSYVLGPSSMENSITIRVYVLNTPRRNERLRHMELHLRDLSINYTRHRAIDYHDIRQRQQLAIPKLHKDTKFNLITYLADKLNCIRSCGALGKPAILSSEGCLLYGKLGLSACGHRYAIERTLHPNTI